MTTSILSLMDNVNLTMGVWVVILNECHFNISKRRWADGQVQQIFRIRGLLGFIFDNRSLVQHPIKYMCAYIIHKSLI